MEKHLGQARRVRYFCQDESRFGLKTVLGRRITLKGVKPVMPVQWQRDNFWLYGAVEPATGEHFFYSFSHLDAACFGRFVELFGAAFPESLNLLHLDQASAHVATTCGMQSPALDSEFDSESGSDFTWPDNVVPIFQPSHSPELNPIERVWQDLKKLFKDHNFPSLPALRQRVFQVVNSLTETGLRSLTGWPYLLSATQHL